MVLSQEPLAPEWLCWARWGQVGPAEPDPACAGSAEDENAAGSRDMSPNSWTGLSLNRDNTQSLEAEAQAQEKLLKSACPKRHQFVKVAA